MGKGSRMEKEIEKAEARWAAAARELEAKEASEAAGAEAMAERSEDKLRALLAKDPKWIARSWRDEKGKRQECRPLPQAARMGWLRGMEILAAAGADPSEPDGAYGGWSGRGRAPLAEAVSRGDWEVAEALLALGARMGPLQDMLWAAGFAGSWRGAGEALRALGWMKARGLDIWADQEECSKAQAAFVSMGSAKGAGKLGWDEGLFEGCSFGAEGERACGWSYIFGAAHDGAEVSCDLLARWAMAHGEPKRAAMALSMAQWGLSGGCLGAAKTGAQLLSEVRSWIGGAGEALEIACAERVTGRIASGMPERDPSQDAKELAAFRAFWAVAGEGLAKSRGRLLHAAGRAVGAGRLGLFEGLLFEGGLGAQEAWAAAKEASRGPGGDALGPAHAAAALPLLMGKALGDGGPKGEAEAKAIFEELSARHRKQDPQALAEEMGKARALAAKRLAWAMDQELPAAAAGSGPQGLRL